VLPVSNQVRWRSPPWHWRARPSACGGTAPTLHWSVSTLAYSHLSDSAPRCPPAHSSQAPRLRRRGPCAIAVGGSKPGRSNRKRGGPSPTTGGLSAACFEPGSLALTTLASAAHENPPSADRSGRGASCAFPSIGQRPALSSHALVASLLACGDGPLYLRAAAVGGSKPGRSNRKRGGPKVLPFSCLVGTSGFEPPTPTVLRMHIGG